MFQNVKKRSKLIFRPINDNLLVYLFLSHADTSSNERFVVLPLDASGILADMCESVEHNACFCLPGIAKSIGCLASGSLIITEQSDSDENGFSFCQVFCISKNKR